MFWSRLIATTQGDLYRWSIRRIILPRKAKVAKEGPDDGYQEWYSTLKNEFTKSATKAAAAEVDEKWLSWKANQLDRLAAAQEREIGAKVREKGKDYIIETAERLGLHVSREKTSSDAPTQSAGRKRTVSGSTLKPLQPTPLTPKPTREVIAGCCTEDAFRRSLPKIWRVWRRAYLLTANKLFEQADDQMR